MCKRLVEAQQKQGDMLELQPNQKLMASENSTAYMATHIGILALNIFMSSAIAVVLWPGALADEFLLVAGITLWTWSFVRKLTQLSILHVIDKVF